MTNGQGAAPAPNRPSIPAERLPDGKSQASRPGISVLAAPLRPLRIHVLRLLQLVEMPPGGEHLAESRSDGGADIPGPARLLADDHALHGRPESRIGVLRRKCRGFAPLSPYTAPFAPFCAVEKGQLIIGKKPIAPKNNEDRDENRASPPLRPASTIAGDMSLRAMVTPIPILRRAVRRGRLAAFRVHNQNPVETAAIAIHVIGLIAQPQIMLPLSSGPSRASGSLKTDADCPAHYFLREDRMQPADRASTI